ncbi:unnamed protein product, partial [Prorocentrum cordatum]
ALSLTHSLLALFLPPPQGRRQCGPAGRALEGLSLPHHTPCLRVTPWRPLPRRHSRCGRGAAAAGLLLLGSLAPGAGGAAPHASAPPASRALVAPEGAPFEPRAELDETWHRRWELRNKADVGQLRELCSAGPLDVLLLGDSITEKWLRPSLTEHPDGRMEYTEEELLELGGDLQAAFPSRRVGVAAVGGDRILDLLWRLRAGGLGEAVKLCAPKAVHVLIGTNDLGMGITPADAGESYRQLVGELVAMRPDAQLTLQLVMPRYFKGREDVHLAGPGPLMKWSPKSLQWVACPDAREEQMPLRGDGSKYCAVMFPPVRELNRMIARVASEIGASGHDARILDCTSFLTVGGSISKSPSFLATVAPDCFTSEAEARVELGGVEFRAVSSRCIPGLFSWCDITGDPVEDAGEMDVAELQPGDLCRVVSVVVREGATEPPPYLSEAKLLGLMEEHGIGTDASMAQHVGNILKRGYVWLDQETRELVPAALGLALVFAYTMVDPGLVRPTVRSAIENECGNVAKGKARKGEVVARVMRIFERKFDYRPRFASACAAARAAETQTRIRVACISDG